MNSLTSQSQSEYQKRSTKLNNIHLPLASLALAIAAVNYAPVAAAQSQQNIDNLSFLEEVVVTARRREESLQDVPISITAMDEDFLRTQNITSIEDLGTHVPSVRISSGGTDTNTPLITIRGQRPSEAAIQLDPAAPMYFNDVVMLPAAGTNLAMYDLQNVQVLKGPQGTLFGRNSTGGAILMTPKRPGEELAGYVEIKMGDYDLRSLEGAVDVPLTDELAIRVAGRKVERDGYQENIANNALNGDDVRGEDSESLRFTIDYEGESFSNTTVLAHDTDKSGSPVPQIRALNTSTQGGGTIAAVFPEYLAAIQENVDRDDPWKYKSDVKAEDEVKNTFASNTTELEFNDSLTIKNIFGYRKVEWTSLNDADGTDLPIAGAITSSSSPFNTDYVDNGNGLGITGADLNPLEVDPTVAEQFSNEIQLLGTSFDDSLDWIVGAYWSKMEGTSNQTLQQIGARWTPVPAFGGFPFPGVYETSSTSALNEGYAVFGEGTYAFSDQWSVTAGARMSWDERELTVRKFSGTSLAALASCAVTGPGGAALAECERTVSEEYKSPTWRVSANYTPDDNTLLYGSVSTGYKAGGFNSRGIDDATLQPFDEETVITYELGHKIDWGFEWAAVRTNMAIFLQQYEDIQQTKSIDVGGTLATQTVNAAKADIKGLEFDVTVAPTENLALTFSYSYVDAGYKDNDASIPDGAGGLYTFDASDNDFVYIPEQSLTASASYTLPVDESLGEMSLMASVYWQDDMSTHPLVGDFAQFQSAGVNPAAHWSDANVAQAEEVSKVDAYEVWNLRFDWRNVMGSQFDVAAFVNNATDEDYVMGGLNVIDVFYTGYTYGAPRTYGASMRYQF